MTSPLHLWRQIDGSNLASNANRHGSIQSCEQTKPCRSIRSSQAGTQIAAKVHHPITAKRQLLLRLARPGHGKRSCFQLLARACLLFRRITRFCKHPYHHHRHLHHLHHHCHHRHRSLSSTTFPLAVAPIATDYSLHEPTRHKPPRTNRSIPWTTSSLAVAPFATDYRHHVPR
jgi:hypothetical protein